MRISSSVVVVLLALPCAAKAEAPFSVQSTDFKSGGTLSDKQVFNGFGCQGGNVSPELSWSHPPAGTKSFVVTVYDPDAPTGSGWWHWVVYNIPASTLKLPEGVGTGKATLPAGAVQSKTDFGTAGFGGACPPPGDKPHRYIFTVYALKTDKLDVPVDASPAMVGYTTQANKLGSASITAHYGRSK